MAASVGELDKLHSQLAKHIALRIEEGEEMVNKKGETVHTKVSAGVLNVARQLLKDCGIEADASGDGDEETRELAQQVRDLATEETGR